MKLATLRCADPDGKLMVVSRDLRRAADASMIAPHLLAALERWERCAPALQLLYERLNAGDEPSAVDFDPRACMAPMPRCFQWCDASAFLNHGRLMEQAFNTPPIADVESIPLMYQGASDDFLGPHEDVPMPGEDLGIDFEGEFGVIVGRVPMGILAADAPRHIRLLVQINDWSLRTLGPREMQTGFGFLQAKPSTSFAPLAITPDELGDAWIDGRVHLALHVRLNEARFGEPHGSEMHFSFGQLLAHAARTRSLSAGTVIGSGTVSNLARAAGSACISERRVIEMIDEGRAVTPFMRFGDRVRMEARDASGAAPFGAIEQRVVDAAAAATARRARSTA